MSYPSYHAGHLQTHPAPHITTSHHDHHGRGESSALNFSEKREEERRAESGQWTGRQGGQQRRLLSVSRGRRGVVQAARPVLPRLLNLFITISFVCCDSCKSGPGGGARPGMPDTRHTGIRKHGNKLWRKTPFVSTNKCMYISLIDILWLI